MARSQQHEARRTRLAAGLPAALLLLALPASARPMNLGNAEPRWVAVRFEVSPADRPAQTRSRFTPRFPARLEPGDAPGQIRITVSGPLVETYLMPGEHPSPGSFSDFVWIFDAATGQVRSARVSGVLLREVSWGFASIRTDAQVDVEMDTSRPVGFQASRLLGAPYHRLCAHLDNRRCTVVKPEPYDPATGYVNAVGAITARSGALRLESFSPLGEAMFSEIDDPFDPVWSRFDPRLHADVASPPPN